MTKVLLLGLGRWGVNHLRNLNAMPVELYVAEVDAKRLEPARKLGLPEARLITQYKDWVSKVDCVVVVTPAQTHFPICKEFLDAGKDVFVEKPITLVSGEAQKLTDLAAKHQRILQVGHIFRFDPASQWLRDAIQAGQFGRVQILRSNFSGFKRPRNDSGVMFADAIHFVDLFNYFMGKTPARVHAVTQDFMGRGMEDASLLSLEYQTDRGTTWATVETNYFLPGKFREVTVIGSADAHGVDFVTHFREHLAEVHVAFGLWKPGFGLHPHIRVAVAEGDDVVALGAGTHVTPAAFAEADPGNVELVVGTRHGFGKDQRRDPGRRKRGGGVFEKCAS